MIPSSPRRTWIFLLVSLLAFYGPGMLAPAAWEKNASFLLLSNIYQGILVVAGFWYGPAICRALVVEELRTGPLRDAVNHGLAGLQETKGRVRLDRTSVVLAEYAAPFVVTAGLLPRQSEVFLSSALVERLGPYGLRFLLVRALVHGNWPQRLAAMLPILAFTVMLPDIPSSLLEWLGLGGFLAAWLAVHWFLELRVDRQAAQIMGSGAEEGLRELLAATATSPGWLSAQPPLRWRLRMLVGSSTRQAS